MKVLPINEIIHGDCLKVMETFPNKSIDMILCDLPYGTTACEWDSVIPLEPLWEQYKRIIKPNGAIVLTASQPFTTSLIASNMQMFKYEWVWDKVRPSGFQIAKYVPMKRHENILVFCDGSPYWNPIKEKRDKSIKGRVSSQSDSSPLKYSDGKIREYMDKNPQSILVFSKQSDGKYVHPTQKPVALFEYLIKTYTQPGEIVLDNCIGSGTTAIAALNTGRNFIGIEKEEKYVMITNQRIKNHKKLDRRRLFPISELETTGIKELL